MNMDGDAIEVPVVQDQQGCLEIPEILSHVLSFMTPLELLNARLVCSFWNDVVLEYHISRLTFDVNTVEELTGLANDNHSFYEGVVNYRLSINSYSKYERQCWTRFLLKYGMNIKSLTLSKELKKKVVELIFSDRLQSFLSQVTHLHLHHALSIKAVFNNLHFLLKLEHLTITSTEDRPEFSQLSFLIKFAQLRHNLKSLKLHGNFRVGTFSIDVLPNIFRTHTIESLEILGSPCDFLKDIHFQSIMNDGFSVLKSISFDDLGKVTTMGFHQFLISHTKTLKKISILKFDKCCGYPMSIGVSYLESWMSTRHSNRAGLSFCTDYLNLVMLKHKIRETLLNDLQAEFIHERLRYLELHLCKGLVFEITRFLVKIPERFPNLTEFVLTYNTHEILPLIGLGELEHKMSEPGRSVWMSR